MCQRIVRCVCKTELGSARQMESEEIPIIQVLYIYIYILGCCKTVTLSEYLSYACSSIMS